MNEEKKTEKMVEIKLPKLYFGIFVIGCVLAIVGCIASITSSIETCILLGIVALIFGFLIFGASIWKIEVFIGGEYLIYHTAFMHTYKINYKDCESFQITSSKTFKINSKTKNVYVDPNLPDLKYLITELKRNHVSEWR